MQPTNQPAQPVSLDPAPQPPQPQPVMESIQSPLQPQRKHTLRKVALIIVGVIIGLFVLLWLIGLAVPKSAYQTNPATAQFDLDKINIQLDEYSAKHNHSFPSAVQFSDGTFTPPVTTIKLKDVTYVPTPTGCDGSSIPCTGFTISTEWLGKTYSKKF